jgi:hypothetical protein
MGILSKILEQSKLNKELLGLWKYNDDEGFWLGHIVDFNENLITIQHFTNYGKKDGLIIVQYQDIKSVDFNDDYSKAMQCVIDYSEQLDKEDETILSINDYESWQFEILHQMEGNYEKV